MDISNIQSSLILNDLVSWYLLGRFLISAIYHQAMRTFLRRLYHRPGPRGRQRRGADRGRGTPEEVAAVEESHTGRYLRTRVGGMAEGENGGEEE